MFGGLRTAAPPTPCLYVLGGFRRQPPKKPPAFTGLLVTSTIFTPHGAFHYSREPSGLAQARRVAPPCGALGHCASPVSLLSCRCPVWACRCCFRSRWGCLLWSALLALVLLPSRSLFLLFALVFVIGFFAFSRVAPPLVSFGGSVAGGGLFFAPASLASVLPRGFAAVFAFRLSGLLLGLLPVLAAFPLSPAFGVEVAPLRGLFFVRPW